MSRIALLDLPFLAACGPVCLEGDTVGCDYVCADGSASLSYDTLWDLENQADLEGLLTDLYGCEVTDATCE
jgi:hypothetical protein